MSDPHSARTVLDLVPGGERLYPVGRLDLDSEGLLLLTNDGDLALRLTHPRYEHEKEYRVLVSGAVTPSALDRLNRGITVDGEPAPMRASVRRGVAPWRDEQVAGGQEWLSIVLREGRKRQIRRMLEAVGLRAERLIRVRMGMLVLGDLRDGQGRWLDADEVQALRASAGLTDGSDPAAPS